MAKHLLTVLEVSELMGFSPANVLRGAHIGELPPPVFVRDEPHFSAQEIFSRIEEGGDDATPSAGVYLRSDAQIFFYPVVKATHLVTRERWPFAMFKLWDNSIHIRPWLTHIVDDIPNHEQMLLSCQDERVPEIKFANLREEDITSITWGYSWVGLPWPSKD